MRHQDQVLGIDPRKEYPTPAGRPITLVREGKVIPSLLLVEGEPER